MANLKVLDGDAAAKYLSTDGAGTNADPHVSHHVLDANTDGVYIGDIKFGESLLAGTNAIGKLAANSGVDIGDVTINNASGASAVNIQDGGNTITVDGTIAATQSGTWDVGTVTTITNPIAIKNAAADTVTGISGTYDTIDVSLTNGTYRATIDSSGYLTTNINGTITVDTELPAAAALSDTLANPTAPTIGAALLGYDNTNSQWERLRTNDSGVLRVVGNGTAGSADAAVVTVQGIASATPVIVTGDSAGSLTVDQATHDSFNCNANLQQGDADVASGNELYVRGSGTAGSPDAAVLTIQGVGSMTPVIVTGDSAGSLTVDQATAANLKATVYGAGSAGSADAGVMTIQGISSMTPILATLQASDGTDIGNVDIASASFEKAEDAGHSTGDKGVMALAVRHDTISSLCGTDLDYTPLQVDATGYLYTKDKNAASLAVVGGGAESTALRVTIANDSTGVLTVDDGGSSLTVDGSVTANTELAAATALSDTFSNPTTATVGAMNMVWDDANSHWERLIGIEGLSNSDAGDGITLKSYNNDETGLMPAVILGYDDTTNDNAYRALAVTSSGALEIADGGNTITVDGAVAATQSGTWNIGTVTPGTAATNLGKAEDAGHASGDVGVMALTVRQNSAAALSGTDADYQPLITDTNGRLHVLDANSASLAVVGGGAESTALRVTLANDSTGVVSVDDGGGTLTVDGTVTATPSGIQEIEGDEAEGSGNLPQPVLIGGDDGTDIKNINVDASTGDVQVDVTNQVDVGGATPVVTPVTGSASPFSTSYAPSADFWLESITLHLSAAGTTSEAFTVTLNATDGGAYDTLLFSQDLSKGAVTDLVWVPEGGPMLFENSDAIDVAWNNEEDRTYGLRIAARLA